MEPHGVSSPRASSRPTYSCIRCVDRKVRCDRQRPCTACVKHKVECVYNISQQPRRQRRAKSQILEDRLRCYEALLQQQGIDPRRLPRSLEPEPELQQSPSSANLSNVGESSAIATSFDDPKSDKSAHLEGQSQFIHNSLYTRVVEELHDANDPSSEEGVSDDDFEFVLESQGALCNRPRHPVSNCIIRLWQIFKDNVDPLTKIIHIPSIQPAIEKAARDTTFLPRSFEVLMFAIYGAAVMSLDDDDCRRLFSQSRKSLLAQYVSDTKTALARAGFMSTTNLIVLQALVLHLLSVRDVYEPRAVWSLTGVAVRIAEGMSLDRDGASLGLPPFETELRRRIWWLLKTHDFRTAELCGLPKFKDLNTTYNSTKWPTNLNDDQLDPGMTLLPAGSNSMTDFTFLSLRYEVANFAANRVNEFRQQGMGPDQWDLHASSSNKTRLDEALQGLEQLLETKYLRYCDPSQPLDLMVMLIARFSLNIIRFLGHHPRRWASIEQTPPSERQWVWEVSIKLLEQHSMVQSNPQLKRFAWHAPYFQQWHAFIHILDVLKADPVINNAEKAWKLVETIYANTPDMIHDMRKPIHMAVGKLCLKAHEKYENLPSRQGAKTPAFILKLREQHETAKIRRQTRKADRRTANEIDQSDDRSLQINSEPDQIISNLDEVSEFTKLKLCTTQDSPILSQGNVSTDIDPFWIENGYEVGENGGMDDITDLDFMLDQEQITDSNVIGWEQWDSWLINSNLLAPIP